MFDIAGLKQAQCDQRSDFAFDCDAPRISLGFEQLIEGHPPATLSNTNF